MKTLWVTSIPQNAVFAYDLADMKLNGHVDLPTVDVAGKKPISSVANWVTFTPGRQADLRLERRQQFGDGDRHRWHENQCRNPGGPGAQAGRDCGDPVRSNE